MPRRLLPWCLLLLCRSALAADYVNDPLTNPSAAGLGVRGGTFSPAGWTTTSPTDTVWWTVPDALESGSFQFTITGLSLATSLQDADNDMAALYQAPVGVAEPVAYSPYYRNNDMRMFWRIFGTGGGAPLNGATKIEMTRCMVGPPYYDNTCPANCTAYDGIAYAHGQMTDAVWDAATAYQMEITWGGGAMSFSRNGEVLGTINFDGTFAPQPMVAHIGSPRVGNGGSMPVGITVSNVIIRGTPGVQTPVCNAGSLPVDAGPPVIIPCTDGSLGAVQDLTAASWETGVFPDATDLNVEGDATGQPVAVVYLAFPPIVGSVGHAVLRMHTRTEASAQGGSGQACTVSSAWDESTLTWSNRPAPSASCSGGARTVAADTEMEWDVTSLINSSGNQAFAIVSTDGDGAHYFSRESGGCANGPRLLVTPGQPVTDAGTPPAPDAAVTPPLDAGGTTRDASGAPDAAVVFGTDASVARDAATTPIPDGGGGGSSSGDPGTTTNDRVCACSGTPTTPRAAWAGWLLLALAMSRRNAREVPRRP